MKTNTVIQILKIMEMEEEDPNGAEALNEAIGFLTKARWVPISKRMPEESTAVLVWCPKRKNIYCAYFEEKQWWIFGADFQKIPFEIIAWMPLPQPYKEVE